MGEKFTSEAKHLTRILVTLKENIRKILEYQKDQTHLAKYSKFKYSKQSTQKSINRIKPSGLYTSSLLRINVLTTPDTISRFADVLHKFGSLMCQVMVMDLADPSVLVPPDWRLAIGDHKPRVVNHASPQSRPKSFGGKSLSLGSIRPGYGVKCLHSKQRGLAARKEIRKSSELFRIKTVWKRDLKPFTRASFHWTSGWWPGWPRDDGNLNQGRKAPAW